MAFAIKVDGVDDSLVSASNAFLTTDTYTSLNIKLELNPADTYASLSKIFDVSGIFQVNYRDFVGDSTKIRARFLTTGGSPYLFIPLGLVTGVFSTIEFDATTVSGDIVFTIKVNDVVIDTTTIVSSTFNRFNRAAVLLDTDGECECTYITLKKDGVLVNNWDADASDHGAGTPVLDDIQSGNDATGVNMPTDGSVWIDLGGSGITVTVTESGPGFTETINSTLTAKLNASISESGPSFTESINVTLTALTIEAAITEVGPSFTESITATVTPAAAITVSISEQGPSFTESISVTVLQNIEAVISEAGPSFVESINVSLIQDITVSITESGPSFVESIIASIPVEIVINPRNIIYAKRQSTTVRVKTKLNSVTIKRKSNTIRIR